MAKSSGLGDNLYFGGVDISGDTQALTVGGSIGTFDVTGIDKSAHERIGGQRDGRIEATVFFNPTKEHPTLSALPLTDVGCMYARGTALGGPAAALVAKQLNYDGNRSPSGEFTLKVAAQANGFGLEWGQLLTAGIRTDSAATNGTGIDTTASASFGFQAYLQVFSMAGTDVTVKLQDSADNVTFADITSGGFTALAPASAATSQRIAVGGTATVRRYIRAVTTTSGGFSSLAFAVAVVKNTVATVVF